jgi:hypothetical protein
LSRKAKKQESRGVVDTNVLIAGISGFRKPYVRGKNPSADVLYKWAEQGSFVWLVTEDILDEYKEVLKRLRVRSTLIGAVINLIRERAEPVNVHASFEISAIKLLLRFHFRTLPLCGICAADGLVCGFYFEGQRSRKPVSDCHKTKNRTECVSLSSRSQAGGLG